MRRRTILSGLGALIAVAVGATALGRLTRSSRAPAPTPGPLATTEESTPLPPTATATPPATASPTPGATPPPTATPRPFRLAVDRTVADRYGAALGALPERCQGWSLEIVADGTADDALDAGHAEAALSAAPDAPGATLLREEPYVAAFHVTHPARGMSLADLRALASSGRDDLAMVAAPDAAEALHELLGIDDLPAGVLRATSWAEAKERVATQPGAWALLPWDAVDHRVRALPIDGVRPDPRRLDRYPLVRRFWLRAATGDVDVEPLRRILADALCYRPPATVELVAVGDVMLGRTVVRLIAEATPRWPFEAAGIAPILQDADLTFGNLECPVSDRGSAIDKRYTFRAAPDTVAGLTWAGFDVLSLANNHLGDYGQDAVRDTLAHLERAGLHVVGAGVDEAEAYAPRIVAVNGLRLAFLAYNQVWPASFAAGEGRAGLAWMDEERMVAAVRAARNDADLVIVSCHWGIEYSAYPSASEERIARALAGAGADLIIGHHPHVVQGMEYGAEAFTAYSLGNFVFDIDMTAESLQGAVMRCLLDPTGVKTVEFVPVAIIDCRPELMSEEQGAVVLQRMERVTRERGALPAPR